jgi:hypothetical protein
VIRTAPLTALVIAGTVAPPPASPISSADGAAYTGIAAISIGDRCTGSLIETGVDDAPAYMLTNGHCAAGRNVGANDVVLDDLATAEAVFAPRRARLRRHASADRAGVRRGLRAGR